MIDWESVKMIGILVCAVFVIAHFGESITKAIKESE